MLVRDLTRGIQDTNLPDMVPKPGNSLSLISQIGKRCIRHYPTRAGATLLPNRLLATTPPIGRLAYWPATLLPDWPRPSDDDATFARNWNPPSEKNKPSRPKESSSQPNYSSSRPNMKRIGSRTPSAVRFGMRRTSQTTTMHSPLSHSPTKPSLPGSNNNQKKSEPKEEIAPATGQVLESTAHARTAGAASAHDQRTEEVSQRTPSHLPITSIDSHIPPPHSAVNSSFALPLVQSDLNSSFALPPTHSALLPVNDISPKQPPVHHSVTLGHVFNAPNHQPRTPIDQLTERELSLVAEVNRLHAQLRRQEQQSQQPPPDVPAVAVRLSLIQTAASVSEGGRDQAPTAAETETTNREHAVVTHAAPTPTNAASVAERTAQTPTTSSTSKSPCDHARSRITKPMIEALWTNDSSPSPAPDYRANFNRYQPESKPTSTTSVMIAPYEAAKVPSPLGYHSRSTRGRSSNATAQSIHGVPTEFYQHHLSAEVSAQHSTMNKNNNTVWDLSKMQVPDGHEPRPRLFFDTND